jgi:sec-independent protein translocase protein TatA
MAANTLITNAAAGVLSLPHILVVLVIVLLLFGGNRLRNLGGDLGGAIKGFKKAMSDSQEGDDTPPENTNAQEKIINPEPPVKKISKPRAAKPKITADASTGTTPEKVAKPRASRAKAAPEKAQE